MLFRGQLQGQRRQLSVELALVARAGNGRRDPRLRGDPGQRHRHRRHRMGMGDGLEHLGEGAVQPLHRGPVGNLRDPAAEGPACQG